jgi:hypothetical protein
MSGTVDARMDYFMMLSEEEQHAAIKRLAASGMGEASIAAATMLSVEMIRQILGARVGCQECEE